MFFVFLCVFCVVFMFQKKKLESGVDGSDLANL